MAQMAPGLCTHTANCPPTSMSVVVQDDGLKSHVVFNYQK